MLLREPNRKWWLSAQAIFSPVSTQSVRYGNTQIFSCFDFSCLRSFPCRAFQLLCFSNHLSDLWPRLRDVLGSFHCLVSPCDFVIVFQVSVSLTAGVHVLGGVSLCTDIHWLHLHVSCLSSSSSSFRLHQFTWSWISTGYLGDCWGEGAKPWDQNHWSRIFYDQ